MYAEEDLTAVLREGSEGPPPNPERLRQVVRRGRRIRRRRSGLGASGLAAVTAAALALYGWGGGSGPADDGVPVAVRLPQKVQLPAARQGVVALPLVRSVQRQRMGEEARVAFVALSARTAVNVRCAVPNSWLITRLEGRAEGSVGRCGPGDQVWSVVPGTDTDGWVGASHVVRLWVLPPQALGDPGVAPEDAPAIAARTGVWDGAWAVGIYDHAA